MVYGLWSVVCGLCLWSMVHGPWTWSMDMDMDMDMDMGMDMDMDMDIPNKTQNSIYYVHFYYNIEIHLVR